MTPVLRYYLIGIFLINTFLINTADSTLALIFGILSLASVVLILFKEDSTSESTPTLESQPQNEVQPRFADDPADRANSERILRVLQLVQSIMKFDGAFYFRKTEEETLEHAENIVKGASINASEQFTANGTYPGDLLRFSGTHYAKELPEEAFAYYTQTERRRKELFSVPDIVDDVLQGVFVFDSADKETFSEEITRILQDLVSLAQSAPIKEAEEKPQNELQLTAVLLDLYKHGNEVYTEQHFYELVKHFLPQLFVARNLFIVKQLNASQAELVSVLGAVEGYAAKNTFALDEGVIGWGLRNKSFVSVEQLVREQNFTMRFSENEAKPKITNSLVFQPLLAKETYGIGLESEKENAFSEEQRSLLKKLEEPLVFLLNEVLKRQTLLQNSMYELGGQVYSMRFFREIVAQFSRLNARHEMNYSVAILNFDFTSYVHEQHKEIVLKYSVGEVLKLARKTDLLFRYSADILILLLPFTSDEQSMELKQRVSTKLNSARVLIDNLYKEPRVDITLMQNASEDAINHEIWQLIG